MSSGPEPQCLVTDRNGTAERLKGRLAVVRSYRALALEFGVSPAMVWRIINQDHEPKDPDIRRKLGLPVYVLVDERLLKEYGMQNTTQVRAWRQMEGSGKARQKRELVLEHLQYIHPEGKTRNELDRWFNGELNKPLIRLSTICSAVKVMVDGRLLEEKGARLDPLTGHKGRVVYYVPPGPHQRALL